MKYQLELVWVLVEKSQQNTLCINAKFRFPIIRNNVFNKTSQTSSTSGSVKSYQVILFFSRSPFKAVLSHLVSLNLVTLAFVSLAM